MENPVRVYIVAPFEPLRVGLASTIAGAPDMEVVGQATSLLEMVSCEGFRQADVIVTDVEAVNRIDTQELYTRLGEWLPALKVVFLGSTQEAQEIGFDAIPMLMRLNTIGFLLKDGATDRLNRAIRLVVSGAFVCETDVIKRILTRLSHWATYSPSEQIGQLSERETEVLTLVAESRSNKEIARELFLSEGTIKAHVSHIMAKLNAERRTDLVRYALSNGVVPLREE